MIYFRGYGQVKMNFPPEAIDRMGKDPAKYRIQSPSLLKSMVSQANEQPDQISDQAASDAAARSNLDKLPAAGQEPDDADVMSSPYETLTNIGEVGAGGTTDTTGGGAAPPSWFARNKKWVIGGGIATAVAVTGIIIAVVATRRRKTGRS